MLVPLLLANRRDISSITFHSEVCWRGMNSTPPSPELIADLLRRASCAVIPEAGRVVIMSNSEVRSAPPVRVSAVFPDVASNVTASLVLVSGRTDEAPHYHTSHLIGAIVNGRGQLRTPEGCHSVSPGDIVVIPRGALHVFEAETEQPMSYIAYEVSDAEIDYQKHFFS